MPDNSSVQIQVEPRLLRIGDNDVYVLQNIARASVYKENRKLPIGLWTLAGLAVFFALNMMSYTDEVLIEKSGVILLLVAGGYLATSIYWYVTTQPYHALVIESGVAYPILYSRQAGAVLRVRDLVVEALRNPPDSAHVHNIAGDWIQGDKIEQRGRRNIAKQVGLAT